MARKATQDPVVNEMMARFDWAYQQVIPHFTRMERIQKSFDNQINTLRWPTISEIAIPLTFTSVEEQLPFAMKYLFPKRRSVKLTPVGSEMDGDVLENIEKSLQYTMNSTMKLELASFPSIKDCYKFGVGYGMITVQNITPPAVREITVIGDDGSRRTRRVLGTGREQSVVQYKYIPAVCVVPMPDGANPEGPNRASGHFVLDIMPEDAFKDMMTRNSDIMTGNAEQIIKEARDSRFDARMIPADILYSLSGIDITRTNTQHTKNFPCVVPIIKCYFEHHQVWIANGTTRIYEDKDTFQSYSTDLIKFSAWPDGNRWFPMGVTEASESLSLGTNIWYNGLVDLAMYMMNPTRVINTRMLDGSDGVPRGPRADIKVTGDPKQAVSYMDLPQFPQQLFTMGEILSRFHGMANASPAGLRDGSPGLVRGGVNALETLLSTTSGRQFLAAIVLKTGGIQPIAEKTLIKKQLIAEDEERFIESYSDPKTKKRRVRSVTVTADDLRNIFMVDVSLPAARMNSAAAVMERTAFFDRAMQNPELFDMRALYEELAEDDELIDRVMLPQDVVEERQRRKAEAQMAAQEAEATEQVTQEPALAGMTEGGINA